MKKVKHVVLTELLLIAVLVIIEKSLIIAFVSIIIHEFMHIWMAKRKGCDFSELEIHVYGSKVELIELDELSNRDKILIYFSGPMANLVIMAIFLLINSLYDNIIFTKIIIANLSLALFNLIPAYPLDGARILEIILSKKIIYKKAQAFICFISYSIATLFILIGLIMSLYYKSYNISMILVGALIIYITTMEKKTAMYILMGSIFKKRKNLTKNNYIENKSISAYYKQGLVTLMANVDKNRFNIFYVLDDELNLQYILYEGELIEALKKYGNITLEEYKHKRGCGIDTN